MWDGEARPVPFLQISKFVCIVSSESGSVPGIKYSVRAAKLSCALKPEIVSTSAETTFSGCSNETAGFPLSDSTIIFLQIGEAPVTPEATCFIGEDRKSV